ncbi:MAG: hypothetical protein IJF59_00635 [Clostridia bacterium]|nr:hypothetical protein [Clostridia bacterium]MBQ3077775.1 hypothetical protein [Clostridia bacterium]
MTLYEGRGSLVKTTAITGGGLMAAAAVVLMTLPHLFPSLTLTCAAMAGFLVLFVMMKWGVKPALLCYLTAGTLALLLLPQKETALEFLLFFGLYPLVKRWAELRVRGLLCWGVKFLYFNATLLLAWLLCGLLGIPLVEMEDQLWWFAGAFNLVYLLYDVSFTRVMQLLLTRYRRLFE